MTPEEEIMFECQECGKKFPPDPDTMMELHLGGDCPCCASEATPEDVEQMLASGEAFTGEQLAAMSDYELKERNLTPETREKLLNGEAVTVGGICICRECQDKLEREQ